MYANLDKENRERKENKENFDIGVRALGMGAELVIVKEFTRYVGREIVSQGIRSTYDPHNERKDFEYQIPLSGDCYLNIRWYDFNKEWLVFIWRDFKDQDKTDVMVSIAANTLHRALWKMCLLLADKNILDNWIERIRNYVVIKEEEENVNSGIR